MSTLRRLAIAALLASAGCSISSSKTEGPKEGCASAVDFNGTPSVCTANTDCCSYNCQSGFCRQTTLLNGVCRTTPDCGVTATFDPLTCKSGACVTGATCRDDADACTSNSQCCGGHCGNFSYTAYGHCGPNHAPIANAGADAAISYVQPYTLQNLSTDPDGDVLYYTWTLDSFPGSSAPLFTATAKYPTFTPNAPGAYVFRLTVIDGTSTDAWRLTSTDTVTLTAVNQPPVVTVNGGSPITHASRHVALTVNGTATDPDGNPLACHWYAFAPGAPGTPAFESTASCTSFTFTPEIEGDWTVTLVAIDSPPNPWGPVTASITVTCVNDPPVADAGLDRYGNVGVTPADTAPIQLQGSATDINGDPIAFAWTFDAVPAGSLAFVAGTNQGLTGPDTATPSFTPDATGDYVLRVRATDPENAWTEDTVTVHVYQAIRELPHDVLAADVAKTSNRLAVLASDTMSTTKVYLLDPATGNEVTPTTPLDGLATLVAVNADGTKAVATTATGSFAWIVDFAATTPTWNRISLAAGNLSAVTISTGKGVAFLLPSSTSGYIYAIDYGSATPAATNTFQTGQHGHADDTALYAIDYWSYYSSNLKRYPITTKGQNWLSNAFYFTTTTCSDAWVSQTGNNVFTSCGDIYAASNLASAGSLGVSPSALDTAASGTYGVAALAGGSVHRYSPTFAAMGTDTLPIWAYDGNAHTANGRAVMLKSDGTTRYVLVKATWDRDHYGIVTFSP